MDKNLGLEETAKWNRDRTDSWHRWKKLPIGVESFEKLRRNEFYYIDKTGLIRDLLNSWADVNLFTRPRRFGKSLNMSMFQSFFEIGCDRSLFDGLEIAKDTKLCDAYMGKFPVISISLKGVNGSSYEQAVDMLRLILNEETNRVVKNMRQEEWNLYQQSAVNRLLDHEMSEADVMSSVRTLSAVLNQYYGQKVIILIDEYDVPLAKAFDRGYYDQMVVLMRNLFEQALKTNDNLYFAVLTGCMRISKESIFTGLNNLKVLSVSDVRFDEYFGFTESEVRAMLDDYGLLAYLDRMKEWYDGYQFGKVHVYCPWDVVNYCDELRADPEVQPKNYWLNTSGNDVVRRFIERADSGTAKREIERLVAGDTVSKELHQELTYKELYDSVENIWSVLFATGYLTQKGQPEGDLFSLKIPNLEIRQIFTRQIMVLFREAAGKDGAALEALCDSLQRGDAAGVERRLNEYLRKTISIRDTFVKKATKENFYHGILLGLLGFKDSWSVYSNREAGEGYSDILVECEEDALGIVIEVKYAESGDLEQGCRAALEQIGRKHYEDELRRDGMAKILEYGIACFRKQCRVEVISSQDIGMIAE